MPVGVKLTKRFVEGLQGDGKDCFYWDADLPGFGVRLRASGRKYYVVQSLLQNRRGERVYRLI